MKKVAIVCAAGKEGRLLVSEAVSRGYEVTGFVRRESDEVIPAAKKVVKDLFDLTREDLIGFDVVIDAFGAWTQSASPSSGSKNEQRGMQKPAGFRGLYACIREGMIWKEIFRRACRPTEKNCKG